MKALHEVVWGGELLHLAFDPVTHECELRTRLTENSGSSDHVLICRGVTMLRFENEIPLPWNYAEITEVSADYDIYLRRWSLSLMLWSEEADLWLRCAEIELDGELLSPPRV